MEIQIYIKSALINMEFWNPENLGPTINTEGRETFPFIDNNNHLFLLQMDILVLEA